MCVMLDGRHGRRWHEVKIRKVSRTVSRTCKCHSSC